MLRTVMSRTVCIPVKYTRGQRINQLSLGYGQGAIQNVCSGHTTP